MIFLFWSSCFLIGYAYFGYPIILFIAGAIFGKPVKKQEIYPTISMIIAGYNEEKNIEKKIINCLALDYPAEKLEILIGSDGSNDKTNEIARKYASPAIKLFELPSRQGKPGVLNYLVPKAGGDVLVFADCRQMFDKNALKELSANFADENVGCVSGELILQADENSTVGGGIGFYWNYEKLLRECESKTGSMIGATGAIYALRKNLFTVVPPDMLLDDVYIPMKVVEKGYRAVFDRAAIAYDFISKDAAQESKRKIRTLAGNWQLLPCLGKASISWKFISHKITRVVAPYFLICLLFSNIFLLNSLFYRVVLCLQVAFYLAALAGYVIKGRNIKLLNIPYTFCVMNINAIQGLYVFLARKQSATWAK